MSAAPKHETPAFWMEARVIELPHPETVNFHPQPAVPEANTASGSETVLQPRPVPVNPIALLFRFERAICFAAIVFLLMTLSAASHQVLKRNIEAQQSRLTINALGEEIGRLREELQQARMSLETFDAPEGYRTLPIEPGDVATVTLPPPVR